MSNNYKVAGSMKIIWKVADAPTGPYRAFQKRGWPTAYYGSVGPGPAFDCGHSLARSRHQLAQVRKAAMSARAPSETDMNQKVIGKLLQRYKRVVYGLAYGSRETAHESWLLGLELRVTLRVTLQDISDAVVAHRYRQFSHLARVATTIK